MRRFRLLGEPAEVVVIIVTFRSVKDLPTLIESLRSEADLTDMRVIVADNQSDDGSLQLAQAYSDIIAIDTGGNLGYAGGVNRAMAYAGDIPAVLVLNPDLIVQTGCIRALLNRLAGNVGAVVPLLKDGSGKLAHSLRNEPGLLRSLSDALLGRVWRSRPAWLSEFIRDDRMYRTARRIDWATGAAVMVARRVWDAVGQWDERFFLYSEETDYFTRIRAAGFSVWFEPAAEMLHRAGGSGNSPLLDALLVRNKVMYFYKHRPQVAGLFKLIMVLGLLLRRGNRSHDLSRKILLNPGLEKELPKAAYAAVAAENFPPASIIIPAHNECSVIDRTLDGLDQLVAAGTVEVIVVPNGCTDDTADRARRHRGVKVIELNTGSKVAALNLGDAHATRWPRLYLDADIEVNQTALAQAVRVLTGDGIHAARPAFLWNLEGAGPLVRAYYRARWRMPSMTTAIWGAGVYGLSQAGHKILGEFPRLTGDDLLVERTFSAGRKYIASGPAVRVRMPLKASDLIRVLARSRRGGSEQSLDTGHTSVRELLQTMTDLGSCVDAVCFASISAIARICAHQASGGWERDDSTRESQ